MDTHHVRAGQNYDDGRSPRRLAAVLLVAGVAVSFAAGALHPEGADANDHPAAFAECWAAAAALALYGALQAMDGVALKHSADAWAAAQGDEKAVHFAAAEDMRWLEWGMRSYQSFVLGAALILIGIAVGSWRGFPRPLAGIALILVWTLWLLASSLWRS